MAFDAKAEALVSEIGGGTQANGPKPVGIGRAPDVADPDVGAGWAGMACGRARLKHSAPDADCEAPGSRGPNPWPTLPLARSS